LNSGLAWKRNANINTGNVNVNELFEAERYYALALDSTRFLYDPDEYRSSVFRTLKNLVYLYRQNSPKVFSASSALAIRELLRLHPNLMGVGKERIICVIQSIVEASSISPTVMRKAIRDSGHPDEKIAFSAFGGNEALHFDSHQKGKKEARRQMKGTKLEIMQTCDACNKFNEDHKFRTCPW
jgi:hypothetical protein